MADKQTFPRIPSSNWWTLREQFRKTLPTGSGVTTSYLKSLLGLTSDQAARNLISPLRQLGLLDENSMPTALANDWRTDGKYPEATRQMLEKVYPSELRELFSGPDIDRQRLEAWFMGTGLGQKTAKDSASMFLLLNETAPRSGEELKKNTNRKKDGQVTAKKRRTANTIVASKAPAEATPPIQVPIAGSDNSLRPSTNDSWGKQLSLHIDLQIHIAPEATAEQIDHIFASIAKYIPLPTREE
ncbi:MAG TPA: DUF5343 domain-containing protein [Aggregatilineaceae bacterium]|nr:DUF5343 domain-containing protein [Aggregatilineaceae bacterium]